MKEKCLIYNMSGELDDVSHLFPNERLGRIAAIALRQGVKPLILDRANFRDLSAFGKEYLTLLGDLAFHETNPLHEERLRQEARYIVGERYDLLFLNLWHGTGFKFSMDLARLLKREQPGLKIYGVGQKVDWFKEHILRLAGDSLDGLVTGLGYNAVTSILQGRLNATCPNTILRINGETVVNRKETLSVDDYPPACYDPAVYESISFKVPVFSLTLSNQACPNDCVFCVRPENYGKESIRRDPAGVLDEMRELREKQGASFFRFEDSTPPPLALTEISRAIVSSDLDGKIRYSAFSRIDANRSESFETMREAGCVALFFGVESLDDGNLRRLSKGFKSAAAQDTLRRAHAAGIRTVISLIVPIPGETQESMDQTFEQVAAMKDSLDSVLSLPAGVYPPTPWGKNPDAFGIELDTDYIERFVIYPVRYLLPLKHWPTPPFRYGVMGKPAGEMDASSIMMLNESFQQRVSKNLGIPCINDYSFLVSEYLGQDPRTCVKQIISMMIQRDYEGLAQLFGKRES